MKKIKNILISSLIVIVSICTSFFIYSCNDDKYVLPECYYDMNSDYIAYTYKDGVYNKQTKRFLAKFDYNKKIFIDKNGKYYGEIIYSNVLIFNKQSPYAYQNFLIPQYEEIGNIPPIARIRGYIPFQPVYIVDVDLYN